MSLVLLHIGSVGLRAVGQRLLVLLSLFVTWQGYLAPPGFGLVAVSWPVLGISEADAARKRIGRHVVSSFLFPDGRSPIWVSCRFLGSVPCAG